MYGTQSPQQGDPYQRYQRGPPGTGYGPVRQSSGMGVGVIIAIVIVVILVLAVILYAMTVPAGVTPPPVTPNNPAGPLSPVDPPFSPSPTPSPTPKPPQPPTPSLPQPPKPPQPPSWHQGDTTKTWSASKASCASMGKELCSYNALCPNGPGSVPVGSNYSTDTWIPIKGTNRWVQASSNDGRKCQTHDQFGPPSWGEIGISFPWKGKYACCSK